MSAFTPYSRYSRRLVAITPPSMRRLLHATRQLSGPNRKLRGARDLLRRHHQFRSHGVDHRTVDVADLGFQLAPCERGLMPQTRTSCSHRLTTACARSALARFAS
jgi:hypothetical protein